MRIGVRPHLIAVGRLLRLRVETCRSSRMYPDTTCPIKPKFLQLKRRSSCQVSFFEGFPVPALRFGKSVMVYRLARCFLCIYGAVSGTGLLPTPANRAKPPGGSSCHDRQNKTFPVSVTVRVRKESRLGENRGSYKKQRQATNPLIGLHLPLYGMAYCELAFLPRSASQASCRGFKSHRPLQMKSG
jgi:hypothetical protein